MNHHPGLSALNLRTAKPLDGIEIVSFIAYCVVLKSGSERAFIIVFANETDIGIPAGC